MIRWDKKSALVAVGALLILAFLTSRRYELMIFREGGICRINRWTGKTWVVTTGPRWAEVKEDR